MAFVTLEGKITRTHNKGFKLEETITLPDGRSFGKFWTIWSNTEAEVNDLVTVKGELSTKIAKDYQTGEDKLTQKGERIVELVCNATDVTILRKGVGTIDDEIRNVPTTPENAPF